MEKSPKFGSKSTADEVAAGMDMKGKYIVVTGANNGIGFHAAKALARTGANVVMACRDLTRGQTALDSIKQAVPDANLELMQLDLGSFESVRAFVKAYKEKKYPLHVLVNNAGVMADKAAQTTDGFETNFGVNHLGTFLLTTELIDVLKSSAPSRIVNTSSRIHSSTSKVNWDDLNMTKSWSGIASYAQSKLFNIWHSTELERRLGKFNVHSFSLHPGIVNTDGFKNANFLMKFFVSLMGKTPEQGAATTVFCALRADGNTQGGMYFNDCSTTPASKLSLDVDQAKRAWDVSVQLVGLTPEHVNALIDN